MNIDGIKKLPSIPEQVLFGLIFDNFLPPINFPKTQPPISVKKHILIMYRKKIFIVVKSEAKKDRFVILFIVVFTIINTNVFYKIIKTKNK